MPNQQSAESYIGPLPTQCRVPKGAGRQSVVSCVTTIYLVGSNSKRFIGASTKLLRCVCVFTSGTLYSSLGVLPMFACVFWYRLAVNVLVSARREGTMLVPGPPKPNAGESARRPYALWVMTPMVKASPPFHEGSAALRNITY